MWAVVEFSNDEEELDIDSQMYKLTIRMHFDQFKAAQKEKVHFFTTHPILCIASPCTLSNEKYW